MKNNTYDCKKNSGSNKPCDECGCYKKQDNVYERCGKHETYKQSKDGGCESCNCNCGCE